MGSPCRSDLARRAFPPSHLHPRRTEIWSHRIKREKTTNLHWKPTLHEPRVKYALDLKTLGEQRAALTLLSAYHRWQIKHGPPPTVAPPLKNSAVAELARGMPTSETEMMRPRTCPRER